MKKTHSKNFCFHFVFLTVLTIPQLLAQGTEKERVNLDESEEVLQQYLDAFTKSGVPTPKAVAAAFQTAESSGTLENWELAATMANAYANVIEVLRAHYMTVYYAAQADFGHFSYLTTAADYENTRNGFLQRRNDAYVELAKLYLSRDEQVKALSYLTTAVELSGLRPNTAAETLITQIIEFSE